MDSKELIKRIEDFFSTADEKALAEVNAAFSVEIDGDLTLEEYLGEFNNQYFYSHSPESNVYIYSDKHIGPAVQYSQLISFENTDSNYEELDLAVSSNMKTENARHVVEMIKKAA